MIVGSLLFPLITALIRTTVVSAQDSLAVGKFFNPSNALATPSLDFSTNAQNPDGTSATISPSAFHKGAIMEANESVQLFEFDLRASNVFILWSTPLEHGEDEPLCVASRYFNITEDASSGTLSISSIIVDAGRNRSSTSTGTSTSDTGASISTNTIPNESPTEVANSLNPGAQAGISTGVALVGVTAAAGAAFFI
ncbi:hypothetical protein F4819DRAFT_484011 [Hypoxylon fuscum]|nr:hypothetical protein F4819DRAFT_484011 [Hypoxylon fuscum]